MFRELRLTLILALPMVANQVAQMLMGVTDIMMVGRLGVTELAACAFANVLFNVPYLFGMGLLSAVTVLAARAFGSRDHAAAGRVLQAGLFCGVSLGLLFGVLFNLSGPYLHLLGQDAAVTSAAKTYLTLIGWSILPSYLMFTVVDFSEAHSNPWPPCWIVLGGVVLNVFLNWLLIYGNWGCPALGLTGAGWATFASRIITAIMLFLYLKKSPLLNVDLPRNWFHGLKQQDVFRLIKIGFPIGLQLIAEVGAFSFSSIICGWISVESLGAHQITLTCAATTFMFPLGLAMAVTVRTGQSIGRGEVQRIRPIAAGALWTSLLMMSGFALVFAMGGQFIAGLFIQDKTVILLCAQLFIVAAVFQIFDGTQVVAMGALRGMSDVRLPTLIIIFTYWALALPLGYWLAFGFNLGAQGIWIGLATGLAFAAGALCLRLWKKTKVFK